MGRHKADPAAKRAAQKEVMLRRVMQAHKRADALHAELFSIANDLHGTELWLGAYERMCDANVLRTWLAGYVDYLKRN